VSDEVASWAVSWLLLVTPEADSLVAPWRAEHDWAAEQGVPAHVTVRTPFLEAGDWPSISRPVLEPFLPVRLRLAHMEDRPGALVILAEPDEQLRELTAAIGRLWPELPRHKAEYERPRYHMTVVRTQDPALRRRASDAITPQLPIEVAGTELWATATTARAGLVHHVLAAVK
jgi:hypothetical protein